MTRFDRDPTSGLLSDIDFVWIEPDKNKSLQDLAVSPDGRHVYVGERDHIYLLDRDPDTGSLSFRETLFNRSMSGMALSGDGRHLLVTHNDYFFDASHSLQVFERDLDNGSLALLAEYFDDENGIDGLRSPWAVVLSPDGNRVYVSGVKDHALAIFDRDPATGSLSFVEALVQGEGGVDGLVAPGQIAVSPDGQSVYVLDRAQNAVSTFDNRTGCVAGPRTLCLNRERFRVEVDWRNFAGQVGPGTVVQLTSDDSGLFWFFSADNWEMLVKVFDGCSINNRFWVFASATTDVEYTLRVTDTLSGDTVMYLNSLGTAAPAITDTSALATCP